jgi:hypothetical protein
MALWRTAGRTFRDEWQSQAFNGLKNVSPFLTGSQDSPDWLWQGKTIR